MKALEERIQTDGKILPDNVVAIDNFLNHQIDIALCRQMADEIYEAFKDKPISKVLTIEASGIAMATLVARLFNAPLLFAKKTKSTNIHHDIYETTVASYTHGDSSRVFVSKKYLPSSDVVLIIDDFLAMGEATRGLIDICEQAGATLAGIGIAVEKGFQPGGAYLREQGYPLKSLAIIDAIDETSGKITFRKEEEKA